MYFDNALRYKNMYFDNVIKYKYMYFDNVHLLRYKYRYFVLSTSTYTNLT